MQTLVDCVGRRCFPVLYRSWWTRTISSVYGGMPQPTRWPSDSVWAIMVAETARRRYQHGTWSAITSCRMSSIRQCARAVIRAWRPWAAWWAVHRPRGRTWARSSGRKNSNTARATWCRRAWPSSGKAWTGCSGRALPPVITHRTLYRWSTHFFGQSTTTVPRNSCRKRSQTSGFHHIRSSMPDNFILYFITNPLTFD